MPCRFGVFLLFLVAFIAARAADPIRVACLGDSITAGSRVDAAAESYPVQLQQLLGRDFLVSNFGRGGATLWRGGKPNAFAQIEPAVAFNPQVAIVMFGINDTRSAGVDYWSHFGEFEADATALLEGVLAAPSKPRVLLCLPTANLSDFPGLTAERRAVLEERLPRLEAVRAKVLAVAHRFADRGVELVDLFAATAKRPELFFTDAVHFNPTGYRFLAETLRPRVLACAPAPAWAATNPGSAVVRLAVRAPAEPRWAHLSWPKALRSHDGTIILAYLAGEFHAAGGGKSPAVSLSTDNGRTFTSPHVLREFGPGLESTSSGNLALGLTGDHAVVLLAMGYRGDEANNIHGWRSTDNGRTWTPVDTSQLGPNQTGSVVGNIVRLPDGRLLVHGHYRKPSLPYDTGIWQSASADDGRTWGAPTLVSGVNGGEPVLIRAGNRLLSFIRGRGENAIRQHLAVSDDGGATWQTSLTKLEAVDPAAKGLAHPFAMVNPQKPGEVIVLTTERPLPGRVWLWRGDSKSLQWQRERVLLEFPRVPGDPHTDFGYTWLLQTEGNHYLLFFYHGLNHGPNAIWVTDVVL